MKKFDRLGKLKDRMTSRPTSPPPAEESEEGTGAKAEAVSDVLERGATIPKKVIDSAKTVGQLAFGEGKEMTSEAANRLRVAPRRLLEVTASAADHFMATTPTLLASSLSKDLNSLVEGMVKGSATIYDKAMDADYLDPLLKPDLGGSYHRLFDGGHTINGAISAARDASPDDNILQGSLGYPSRTPQRWNHHQRTAPSELGQATSTT